MTAASRTDRNPTDHSNTRKETIHGCCTHRADAHGKLARLAGHGDADRRRGDRRPEAEGSQLDHVSDDSQRLGLLDRRIRLGRPGGQPAGNRRRPGTVAAGVCHRRHGSRRRQIAGRGRRLDGGDHHALCLLRLGLGRRSDRRGDGPVSPGLGKASRAVLDDSQRSHHDSRPGVAVGDCGRTQEVDAAAPLRNSHRARIDRLLFLGRHADLNRRTCRSSQFDCSDQRLVLVRIRCQRSAKQRARLGQSRAVSNWRSSAGRAEEIDREHYGRVCRTLRLTAADGFFRRRSAS